MATNGRHELRRMEDTNGDESNIQMPTNMNNENKIMYKELSYKLQGLFFDIRNDLGSGHKESIYQKALEKELERAEIKFLKEPPIKIYSQKGEFLGLYRPDFLIEDKIIIELKAVEYISRQETARVYDYLRNSKYELGYFVNFASPRLFVKRLIFTNDRKTRIPTNQGTNTNEFVAIRKSFRCNSWIILFVAISVLLVFVAIRGVNAAEISLLSGFQDIGIGEKFKIDVVLNTEGEVINAFEGKLIFPDNFLIAMDIQDGNSIANFWVERPNITRLAFSGIIPGGHNDAKGFLFSVIFEAKQEGTGTIEIQEAKVLLNDGDGTQAKLLVKNFPFVAISAPIRDDSWVSPMDTDPPEDFKPEIASDPSIFEGKWFLVFATQDKISGIARYFVHESTRKKSRIATNEWVVTESPYVLKDQDLKSFIFVKAVDKAGNERVAVLRPKNFLTLYKNYLIWSIIILIIIFIWKKLLIH